MYQRNIGCGKRNNAHYLFKTHVEHVTHSCLVLAGHKVQDLVGSYSV